MSDTKNEPVDVASDDELMDTGVLYERPTAGAHPHPKPVEKPEEK